METFESQLEAMGVMFVTGDIVKTTSFSTVACVWSSAREALWNFGFFEEWRSRRAEPISVLPTVWPHGFTPEVGVLILAAEHVVQNNTRAILYQSLDGASLQFAWFVDVTDGKPPYWRKINA